jgi:ribosomal-protein-alanine N-acetyltransferase
VIRTATPADLPALRALQSLLPAASPQLLTTALYGPGAVVVSVDEPAGSNAATDRSNAVASGDATPTDAAAAGVPAGYVLAMNGPETAHIAELVVAPAHRREGRGRRLLAAALGRLRGTDATSVELAVKPDNDAARRLYEAFGFEEKTRIAEYYEDGDTAVLMRRPL